MARTVLFAVLALFVFASLSSAGCAQDAYNKACASCSFDAQGKIDQSCSGGYQASGTACVSSSYPIMAGKYAAGKCPEVDACADELRSCTAQYATGNDKADCQEGSLAVCYSAADQCTKSAAVKCGEIQQQCPGSATAFVLLVGATLFYKRQEKA